MIGLRSLAGTARSELLARLKRRSLLMRGRGPFVSFSFDDFPRSALLVGGKILKQHGVRGTYYVAIDLQDRSTELGQHFCDGDLSAVLTEGHELANHTHSHLSARHVPFSVFASDAALGLHAVQTAAGSRERANFAYPYGHVTLAAKAGLDEVAGSCRGTYPGLNGPEVDLRLLRANPIYGDVDASANIVKLIERNRTEKKWLVFYTHDVSSQPSRFGCTPRLLDCVVRAAVESGASILPVAEVLATLQQESLHE